MDMLGITGEALADRSGWALAGVFVLLLAWGRLIPRSSHEDRIRDKDEQIADLRELVKARDKELVVRGRQVDKLLSHSDLSVHLMEELAREAGRDVAS